MRSPARDALINGALGLLPGAAMGMIAAGAFATWRVGGAVQNVGLTTILDFLPSAQAALIEPTQTALMVGAGVTLACGALAAALGWRPALDAHGTARWATAAELAKAGVAAPLSAVRGPIFGKLAKPKARGLYVSTDRTPHSLIAAPTGSGKGVGVVIPTLLTWPGSILCLDVKGENFRAASRRRRAMGDRVFKFSPYDAAGRTHRFNPLDFVSQASEARRFTEARRLASSLIVARSQSAEGFVEGAREIFAAACVHAIERDEPTIGAVYDLLSQHGEAHKNFAAMAEATAAPEARSVFNRMAATDSRVLSSYLSVLSDGGLSIWADGAVRDATAASDFSVHDMRRTPASVFIVVSPNDLAPLAPLVRLIFQQSIATLQRAEPGPDESFPVLFLLDEFASLGRMDVLSAAITTLRGFGGRVMIVVQSMANLRQHYGAEGATNFLANCGVQLFMAPADAETPEYVSKAIGQFTRRSRSKSWRTGELAGVTMQERVEGAALVRPEEFRRLGDDMAVALLQGRDPAKVWKVRYFEDRELKRIFDAQKGALPEPPSLALPASARNVAPVAPPPEVRSAAQEPPEAAQSPLEGGEATEEAASAGKAADGPPEALQTPQASPVAVTAPAGMRGRSSAAPPAAHPSAPTPTDAPSPGDDADAAAGLRIIGGKLTKLAAGVADARRQQAARDAEAEIEGDEAATARRR